MNTINQFQAIGRITKPPKFYPKENHDFITFTISVERDYRSKLNKPIYDFLNCKAFGALAIEINQTLSEGDIVGITGHIQTRRFDYNGENRYTTELLVTTIQHLSLHDELPLLKAKQA